MSVVPYPQGQNVGELRNMANVEVLQYRKPNGETVKNIFFWVLPVLIFLLSGMTRPGMVFNSANFTFLLIKGLCGLTISVAIAVIRSRFRCRMIHALQVLRNIMFSPMTFSLTRAMHARLCAIMMRLNTKPLLPTWKEQMLFSVIRKPLSEMTGSA